MSETNEIIIESELLDARAQLLDAKAENDRLRAENEALKLALRRAGAAFAPIDAAVGATIASLSAHEQSSGGKDA